MNFSFIQSTIYNLVFLFFVKFLIILKDLFDVAADASCRNSHSFFNSSNICVVNRPSDNKRSVIGLLDISSGSPSDSCRSSKINLKKKINNNQIKIVFVITVKLDSFVHRVFLDLTFYTASSCCTTSFFRIGQQSNQLSDSRLNRLVQLFSHSTNHYSIGKEILQQINQLWSTSESKTK